MRRGYYDSRDIEKKAYVVVVLVSIRSNLTNLLHTFLLYPPNLTLLPTGETEPLIPSTARFLLTTNSSLVASSSASSFELNDLAYGRYFDRPEVRRAYKEQQLIQTPEFTQLSDDIIVGGRFRPREAEDVRLHCFFSFMTHCTYFFPKYTLS